MQCRCSHFFIWSLRNAACYCATYSFGMPEFVKSMTPVIVGLNG